MFEAFFAAAVLSVLDPAGDVTGDGSLKPPTAGVYRNLAPFDLRRITLTDDEQLTLIIEMGSLTDPFELPLGFSLPIIEVYLGSAASGGESALLAGSGMSLPVSHSWHVAVRLTGEQAEAHRWTESGIESVTPAVTVDGNELTVRTPFPRPQRPRIYAMTGLYDLFGSSRWRPLDHSESPWAFSSTSQNSPVVDVLAVDEAAQRQSIESRTLLPAGGTRPVRGAAWLLLMALGLLIALVGITMRTLARRSPMRSGDDGDESVRAVKAGRPTTDSGVSDDPRLPQQSPEPGGSDEGGNSDQFVWDSSALLTEPDDEFAEEFTEGRSQRRASAWVRPVPLPVESTSSGNGGGAPDGEPELVTDDLEPERERREDGEGLEPETEEHDDRDDGRE